MLAGVWAALVAAARFVAGRSGQLPAAARHLAWCATLGAMLASAILALAGAEYPIEVLAPSEPASIDERVPAQVTTDWVINEVPRPVAVAPSAAPIVSVPPRAVHDSKDVLAASLSLVWAAGALLLLARMVRGFGVRQRLRRDARPLTAAAARAELRHACELLCVRSPISLHESPTLSTPATLGIMRPVILLPVAARAWSAERLRTALVHEVAHVARRDAVWHLVALWTRVVGWWHPAVWLAVREQGIAREQACDDLVLRAGAAPVEYAQLLLEIAIADAPTPGLTHVLAMARPAELELRIAAILAPSRARGAASRTVRLLLVPAVLSAGLLTAARPVPRSAPEVPRQTAGHSAIADATQALGPPLSTLGLGVSDSLAGTGTLVLNGQSLRLESWRGIAHLSASEWVAEDNCARMRTRRPAAIVVADLRGVRARAADASRCLALHAEGPLDYSVDGPDIGSLAPNGSAELWESRDGVHYAFFIRVDRNGQTRREFRRNGYPMTEVEGKSWLAGARVALARQTGLGLERWTRRLAQDSSTRTLLREARLVSSSEARRDIYRAFVAAAQTDPAALDAVLRDSRSLPIDAQRTQVLQAIVHRLPDGVAAPPALFASIRSLRASSSRAELLRTLCARSSRPVDDLLQVLALVPGLSGDDDMADVLSAVAGASDHGDGLLDAAFTRALRALADPTGQRQAELRRAWQQ